jgi:hypothetical protein
MSEPLRPVEDETLPGLVSRIIENLKAYIRAEVQLIKVTASTKAGLAFPAVGLFIVALVFLQVALTVFTLALGALLAIWLGWAGGLAVAALVALTVAGLFAWIGARRMTRAFR